MMVFYSDKRRHIVREQVASIELEGSLDDAICELKKLKEEFEEQYFCLKVVKESDEGCYECGRVPTWLVLVGDRKENENEKNLRLRKSKVERKKKEKALAKKREKIRKEAEKLGMKLSE